MSRTFYVTTPIYYVNDAPHIGHAYTTVLADVLARYHKLLGDEVFFLTGTDEHGQKVQQAAEKSGLSPQEHCDLYSQRFRKAWDDLNIDYDYFIRTTDPVHIAFVREQMQRLWDKGRIYPKEYAGWYSTSEERFFSEDELVDGKDPISGRAVEWITEKNYFFKMSEYQQWLIDHINDNPDFILPDFRKNEVLGFLRQPLKDLCISRPKSRLSWGISLPFDEDYVAYVWVDALLNYASAVSGKIFSNGESIWPADFHLIGKDILTTHAVYWPTLLKALDLPLPKHILAHGWWMIDNARMSKTTGNAVSPLAMKDKYGVDAFRFFLIRAMIVGQDASFTEEAFINTVNADLANDVGNALSRVLKLTYSLEPLGKLAITDVEWLQSLDTDTGALNESVRACIRKVKESVTACQLSQSVDYSLQVFREVNRYLEIQAPWKLAKGGDIEKKRLNGILWNAAEALRIGFTLLYSVMPRKVSEALDALGYAVETSPLEWRDSGSFFLKSIPPLFPRIVIEKQVVVEDPFSSIDLCVVKILSAVDHPNAEALYILQVDVGVSTGSTTAETRTVCAGLRKHLTKEEIIGKTAVLVANLKPASLRGVMSQGMLLAAGPSTSSGTGDEKDKLSLVNPEGAQPGDRITAEGLESNPKPQITWKDFEKCALSVQGGKVYYGKRLLQSPHGPVLANAPDGAVVR